MLKLLLLLLNAMVAVHGTPSVISGVLAPQVVLPNQCGAQELLDGGRVHIDVVLYGYCTNTTQNDLYASTMKKFLKRTIYKSERYFLWQVTGSFSLPDDAPCSLSAPFTETITGRFPQLHDEETTTPDIVQLSVVLPDAETECDVSREINTKLASSAAVSTLTICTLSVEACDALRSSIGDSGDRYGMFVLDPERLNDIGGYPKVMHMMSSLGCNPSFLNAIPYETDVPGQESPVCECVCEEGKKFQSIAGGKLKRCVSDGYEIKKDSCSWLNQCFQVTVGQSTSPKYGSGTCDLKGYFEKGLITVPCPWDNYVSNDLNIMTKGAKLNVKLTNKVDGSVLLDEDMQWVDAQPNMNSKLESMLPFTSSGQYELIITASDYKQSESCSTSISIKDDVPPVGSAGTCPKAAKVRNRHWPQLTPGGLPLAVKVGEEFEAHVASRKNDGCGDGSSCDYLLYKVKNFFDANGVTTEVEAPDSWQTAFDFNTNDLTGLASISDNILNSRPGGAKTKCWWVGVRFGEHVVDYTCDGDFTNDDGVCKRGPWCNLLQCVSAHPHSFFYAHFRINGATKRRTNKVNRQLNIPDFSKAATEIHEIIEENAVGIGPGEGTLALNLTDHFDVVRRIKKWGSDHNADGVDDAAEKFIKCRYDLGDGFMEWDFDGPNTATFTQEDTEVILECWTALGRIRRTSVKVVVHPHAILDICDQFIETSWYQSLNHPRRNARDAYCNIPDSDFAEITFDFIHDVGREPTQNAIPYDFQNITCTAYYLKSLDGGRSAPIRISDGVELFSYADTQLRLIERFGVELKHEATDSSTPVEFECLLYYKSKAGKVVPQECSKDINFCDCDAPLFPSKEDPHKLKKCMNNCADDEIQPFGYCGANYLSYKRSRAMLGNGEAVFSKQVEDQCCTSCGEYSCVNLANAELAGADHTLKRCELPQTATALLLSDDAENLLLGSAMQNPLVASGIFIAVFVVMGIVVRFSRRFSDANGGVNNETYSELLL